MSNFCRIQDGKVVEVIEDVTQGDIDGMFYADVAADFVEDTSELAEEGWDYNGPDDFSAPVAAALTWDDIRMKQRNMIVAHQDLIEIHEREVAHDATAEVDYSITPAKYQEWLGYFQDVRANDEALHATPADADAALDALTEPATPGYNS